MASPAGFDGGTLLALIFVIASAGADAAEWRQYFENTKGVDCRHIHAGAIGEWESHGNTTQRMSHPPAV